MRIFGHKTENTATRAGNTLYFHRRRLRRAIASFIFTPFYALPFFYSEIFIPGYGGYDILTPTAFLLAINIYSASIIHEEKTQYPYVHKVLFNPYDGGVVLMREQWRSVINPLNFRRPKLEIFYIKMDDEHKYKPIGVTMPDGFVIQKSEQNVVDGDVVPTHEGFVHSDAILNEVTFDNYMNELLESKLMNEMISIRFQKDRVFRLPDITFGHDADLVEIDVESDRFIHAKQRRSEFAERHKHPTFYDAQNSENK